MSEEQHIGQKAQSPNNPTIVINQQNPPTNGIGVAGFVVALVTLFLFWVPVLNWILWLVGLVLSALGLRKKPKALAIAGVIISIVVLILMIVAAASLAALFHN